MILFSASIQSLVTFKDETPKEIRENFSVDLMRSLAELSTLTPDVLIVVGVK
jgi:hypothetical protein